MSDGSTRAVPKCVQCGGVGFRWRVKRVRGAGSPASRRTLVWSCGGCGAQVEEPLAPGGAGQTRAGPR